MDVKMFGILLVASLLLFGCTQQAATKATVTPTAKALVTAQASSVSTPKATAAPTTVATQIPTAVPPTSDVPTSEPTVAAQPTAPEVQSFSVETDDNGWYPDVITVKKDVPVKLTITIRKENVYFGGADIKSDEFKFPNLKAGDVRVAEFTPTRQFGVENRWPNNAVLKGTLIVAVK